MEQNVYMVSMVFPIPLINLKDEYIKDSKNEKVLKSSFILYPNVKCKCWEYDNKGNKSTVVPKRFFYNSSNGLISNVREIEIKPMLMELDLGIKMTRKFSFASKKKSCQYFLLLLISIDKVFEKNKDSYLNIDFCTEFDIVNLKKAFFENKIREVSVDRKYLDDWLKEVLLELEKTKRKEEVQLSYTIIDICTQRIDIKNDQNILSDVTSKFTENYYQNSAESPIDNYLNQCIVLHRNDKVMNDSNITSKFFVYGLLYANDNFMMLDKNAIEYIISECYTNNKVEKFWADDETIVHIKTNTPYFCSENKKEQKLTGDLMKELPTLVDMSMLIYMKFKLQEFEKQYKKLTVKQIEKSRGMLSELLCGNLYNQTEMDKRKDFFISQFCLHKRFKEILNAAISHKNAMEISYIRSTNIWIIVISLLTLLVTIVGIACSCKII